MTSWSWWWDELIGSQNAYYHNWLTLNFTAFDAKPKVCIECHCHFNSLFLSQPLQRKWWWRWCYKLVHTFGCSCLLFAAGHWQYMVLYLLGLAEVYCSTLQVSYLGSNRARSWQYKKKRRRNGRLKNWKTLIKLNIDQIIVLLYGVVSTLKYKLRGLLYLVILCLFWYEEEIESVKIFETYVKSDSY